MPRAYTREPTRPDEESEQTHDDCEWLNEEDREEDVLRHWRDGDWRRRTPRVAQHFPRSGGQASVTQNQSTGVGGQDNSDAEHRRSDSGNKRGVGLVGLLTL